MKNRSVLYGVLNWGLGHASRSKPIINYLLSKNYEVTIASDGDALELLKIEFPKLSFVELPPYNPSYSKTKLGMPLKILLQIPRLFRTIKKEHGLVEMLVRENSYDLVISDNRYGCYSKLIPCAIICHQIQIKAPIGSSWINRYNHQLLSKFNRIWVPDYNGRLSGELSNSKKMLDSLSQIGWISAYTKNELEKDIDLLIVLSGPEPQRSILETRLNQIVPNNKKIVLVRGKKAKFKHTTLYHEVHGLCPSGILQSLLNRSKMVLSRSGYSSLMDFKILNLPAIIIPTPGQSEQTYLASRLKHDGQFMVLDQSNLSTDIFDWSPRLNNSDFMQTKHNINALMLQKQLNELTTMQA